MEQWTFNSARFEIVSMYLLQEEAWTYELTGPWDEFAAVTVPDATPGDQRFTPRSAASATVLVGDGRLPWPLLTRFVELVGETIDIVAAADDPVAAGDFSQSAWQYAGRRFEVRSFALAERAAWCFELYADEDRYLTVHVPDGQPADLSTLSCHHAVTVPWAVFRHFLSSITATGRVGPMAGTLVNAATGAPPTAIPEQLPAGVKTICPRARDLGAGDIELVLLEPGPSPADLAHSIRRITGFNAADATALVESSPSVVLAGLDAHQAADLCGVLRAAGATAETRARD